MPGGAEPPWEVQEWWKGRGSPRWLPAAGVSAPGAAARGLGEVFASRPSACWQQGWGWAGAQSSQPAVARAAEVTRSSCCYGLTSGSRLLNTERPHLAQGRRNKLSFIAGLDALRSLQTPFLMPSKLLSPRQRLFFLFFSCFSQKKARDPPRPHPAAAASPPSARLLGGSRRTISAACSRIQPHAGAV